MKLLRALSAAQRRACIEGIRYTLAISPSYLVFGTVCGVAAKQSGFDALQAMLLPALVFGGSSQVVLTSLIMSGAPLLVVILSAVMVNSRMAVYSAALSQDLLHHPQSTRTAVASLLVDQTIVGVQSWRAEKAQRDESNHHWLPFYFGAGISLWLWWLLCNGIGYFLGAVVPPSWQLEFAVPLSFVAVLAPIVRKRPMAVAAILGAVLGVALFALPLKFGLIAACILGVMICLFLDYFFAWTPANSGSQ